MVAYLYIYKQSFSRGRPSWGWVKRCKWLFLRHEDSERFKHVLAVLERWYVPMVAVGRENRVKGYVILKIGEVREFLSLVASDLLHDAYISDQRMRSLEDHGWELEMVKVWPMFYAIWQLGISNKARNKLKDVRDRYKSVVQQLKDALKENEVKERL